MRLWRAHGLGNDYLVLVDGPTVTAGLARALCDRHTGVGADGVLEPIPTDRADHGVRIWNPDGSIAEKSGNGLRILARFLADRGAGADFTVWTGSEVVRCRVGSDAVSLDIGRATFEPGSIPIRAPAPVLGEVWVVAGAELRVHAVGIGNPHCVVLTDVDDLDTLPWREWGRALEGDWHFPNRTNVQIARVVARDRIEMRIWERGAGETRASGTSSCAVAAVTARMGRVDFGAVTVDMPGGQLRVDVAPDFSLVLTGPVAPVAMIELDPRWERAER